jgi:hypothetical protein
VWDKPRHNWNHEDFDEIDPFIRVYTTKSKFAGQPSRALPSPKRKLLQPPSSLNSARSNGTAGRTKTVQHPPVPAGFVGLENDRHTEVVCWLNGLLQAIVVVPPFADHLDTCT